MKVWDRYSRAARWAVYLAQNRAQESGWNLVTATHVAIGCVLTDGNVREYLEGRWGIEEIEHKLARLCPNGVVSGSDLETMGLELTGKAAVDAAYDHAKRRSAKPLRWLKVGANDFPIQTEDLLVGCLYADPAVMDAIRPYLGDLERFLMIVASFPAEPRPDAARD